MELKYVGVWPVLVFLLKGVMFKEHHWYSTSQCGMCTYQDYFYLGYLYFNAVLSQWLQLKSSLSLSIIMTEYKI